MVRASVARILVIDDDPKWSISWSPVFAKRVTGSSAH
jgi:hypothetical protein